MSPDIEERARHRRRRLCRPRADAAAAGRGLQRHRLRHAVFRLPAAEQSEPARHPGRHPRHAEAGRGAAGPGRGPASRLHLQRRELRARREAVRDHQLRLLRADGDRGQSGRREALRLLLVELGLRRERLAQRDRGPSAGAAHALQQVQGHVRAAAVEAQGRRLHLRHDPPGHGLRLQPAHAARPVGQHPHQPRRQQGHDHGVRRHPDATEPAHRGHGRRLSC